MNNIYFVNAAKKYLQQIKDLEILKREEEINLMSSTDTKLVTNVFKVRSLGSKQ